MALIGILLIIAMFGYIVYLTKKQNKEYAQDEQKARAERLAEWEKEREMEREAEEREVRKWLEGRRLEHGPESALFSGWGSSSKGIVFFDDARVLYVEGKQYQYSSVEDCQLVVVYDEEDDDYYDELEYEEDCRRRKNDVVGSVIIGSAIGGAISGSRTGSAVGAVIGAMTAESSSENFIVRYLPKANASREINHYEVKIAFKEEDEYIVFEVSGYKELNAQRAFNYLLRIIGQNQNPDATRKKEGIADKILRLGELKERGLISESEFGKIKENLLNGK